MVQVPFTLSSGGTISASELNANFDALEGAAANLTNASLAANAGITSDKLADRYAVFHTLTQVLPFTAGTDLGTPTEFTVPASDTAILTFQLALGTGQEAYLCEVEFHVANHTSPADADPTLGLQVEGTLVGGAMTRVLTDNSYRGIRNASPIALPLISVTDGDEFEVMCGRSSGAGDPSIAGVTLRMTFKIRVSA